MNALGRLRRLKSDVLDALNGRPAVIGAGERELGVLFVCYGNSCRSPLAHGIFRAKLAEAGLLGRVVVDSAGTYAGDPGAPPDPRARTVARKHGITIGDLRSRRFEPSDFDRFERILVLDRRNREAVLAQARDDDERARVRLLRDAEGEVVDPVFGTLDDFERAYAEIDEACDLLLDDVRAALAR
jgi:protein-tyrosine phosphatase